MTELGDTVPILLPVTIGRDRDAHSTNRVDCMMRAFCVMVTRPEVYLTYGDVGGMPLRTARTTPRRR